MNLLRIVKVFMFLTLITRITIECVIMNTTCNNIQKTVNLTYVQNKMYYLSHSLPYFSSLYSPFNIDENEVSLCYKFSFFYYSEILRNVVVYYGHEFDISMELELIEPNNYLYYKIKYTNDIEENCANQFESDFNIIDAGENYLWIWRCHNISNTSSNQGSEIFVSTDLFHQREFILNKINKSQFIKHKEVKNCKKYNKIKHLNECRVIESNNAETQINTNWYLSLLLFLILLFFAIFQNCSNKVFPNNNLNM